MSDFKVEIVRVGKIGKHPNADSLSITHVYDYPVIIKTDNLKEGDLAVYIPVDAVVPDTEPFKFLKGHLRIKARKLRGIFSMGLLMSCQSLREQTNWDPYNVSSSFLGCDVAAQLGITKYEQPVDPKTTCGDADKDTGVMPKYTDIQHQRKYGNLIPDDMEVVLTEKVHGANGRVCVTQEVNPETGILENKMYVGSHNTIKKYNPQVLWWKVCEAAGLKEKLSERPCPDFVFYFEVYGWVQDLRYGHSQNEQSIAFFDIFDRKRGIYLDYDDQRRIFKALDLPVVPRLFRGTYGEAKKLLPEFKHTFLVENPNGHIMEGVVIKPVVETWNEEVGRLVLKYITEDYLLRKNGTEAH